MEGNNNKLLITLMAVIIVILGTLCILFATGTISLNANKDTDKEVANETTKDDEKETLPEWVSYILSQNITSIEYYSGTPNESTTPITCEAAKALTKDQLKTILVNMSKNVKKIDVEGLGGICWTGIKIKYNNTELDIYASELIITSDVNDSKVLELLAKENYPTDTTATASSRVGYKFTWDKSYIDTIVK